MDPAKNPPLQDGGFFYGRLYEISENLHRADLTTLQRNEQIAEWIRLTEAQADNGVSRQVAAKPKGGRPAGGIAAAARELGVENTEARRALKIDGIAPAAKEAARAAGLENNQSALLKVSQAELERQAFAFCTRCASGAAACHQRLS